MVLDPASGRPAYQQIADELRQRIRSGALAPGSRLPTEVELMGEFDVCEWSPGWPSGRCAPKG